MMLATLAEECLEISDASAFRSSGRNADAIVFVVFLL